MIIEWYITQFILMENQNFLNELIDIKRNISGQIRVAPYLDAVKNQMFEKLCERHIAKTTFFAPSREDKKNK